ncbi:substrate-binding domain-containing protein [Lacrimispora aerotolerans]|uniref:substrate-binding domain-containing protein n=1 Tax=Lacrimispora aerotolerans TaxID=36832 RepID=UPI000478DF5B|nr:helix-turn-helix transcriptional regulator [Lacrimispora aerotolerans]
MEKIYTPQEVADRLLIKKATVYELIKRGELNATKIGRQIRVSQEQLDSYLKGSSKSAERSYTERSYAERSYIEEALPQVTDIPRFTSVSGGQQTDYLLNNSGLVISSQESRVVELLRGQLGKERNSLPILHSYMNDYNSLYSLYYEKTHLALTCFLSDGESWDRKQIKNLMPGKEVAVLSVCSLLWGFYVKKGNPLLLRSMDDLTRPEVRFLNRELGSGSRMYLDSSLLEKRISKDLIYGYEKDCLSNMSAAHGVASGAADISIGDISLLSSYPQLESFPFAHGFLDLVFLKSDLDHPAFQSICNAVNSEEFKSSLQHFKGYDTSHTGNITIITN